MPDKSSQQGVILLEITLSGITNSSNNHAAFIWKIADNLRGYYKATDYGKIILPFTILARLDSVLEPYKEAMKESFADREDQESANISDSDHYALIDAANDPDSTNPHQFYNTSGYSLKDVNTVGEVHTRLMAVINGFSADIRPIFNAFDFERHINKLDEHRILLTIVQQFINADLSPSKVSNMEMGLIFEELIRKFAEDSAADNGEYFTPREVIDLAARLVITPEEENLKSLTAPLRSIYDPTAGTGGMLSVTEEYIKSLNPKASVDLYGQELNEESYAICLSDMILKGQDVGSVKQGNTLSDDKFPDDKFDYCLSNPPYGTDWNNVYDAVIAESKKENGRFGAGVPKKSDGQLLFLQHVVSKLRDPEPDQRGGRAAVVMNGSSLFTGDAGSGESEIRRWMFESDFVDAIVALPVNMFYSTGITTYIWIIDKDKPAKRKGKTLLIDASKEFEKMRKNLGMKSNRLSDLNLSNIIESYLRFETSDEGVPSKVFANEEFGYRSVVVEHPLKARYSWNAATAETLSSSEKFAKVSADRQKEILSAVVAVFDEVEDHVNSRQELDALLDAASKTMKIKSLTKAEKDLIAASLIDAEAGEGIVSIDAKGKVIPDVTQRETETIPLVEEVDDYLDREVRSYDAAAWIDELKTKIGYEVLFNRHFYKKESGRTLDVIEAELEAKIATIAELLGLHVIEADGSVVKPASISELDIPTEEEEVS
jgi:type I restriction enzyme M protein